jgi:hypothetical protein
MTGFQMNTMGKKSTSILAVLALAASIAVSPVETRVAEAGVLGGALGGALFGGLIGGRGGMIGGAIVGGVVGGIAKNERRRRDRAYYYRGRMDARSRGRHRRRR